MGINAVLLEVRIVFVDVSSTMEAFSLGEA